ncbi:hypothetical protein [Roseofilum casamattae]|uniref:LapA family protein n=1 Tax=Roseofilum casamattae BLCC-M143 TaxID=3022442 RepID=A0ABT7BT78_9CYAN|nr:hypothetical protein [Roseofilum casamattae]MDJ1182002.1 hypothetical protein [Roseofilum casamattae BLCC-M143]
MNQRIILSIALGVSLVFVAQNLTPTLSVVFLGMRSPALPVGIWLFLGFTLGAIVSKLMGSIVRWSATLQSPAKGREEESRRGNRSTNPPNPPSSTATERISFTKSSTSSADWEQENPPIEEWDNREWDKTSNSFQSDSFQSDSFQSDSFQSDSFPVENPPPPPQRRVENVYDTDYRVIVPPYSPGSPPPAEQPAQDSIQDKPKSPPFPSGNSDWENREAASSDDEVDSW